MGNRPLITVDLDECSFMNAADATAAKNIDAVTYKTSRPIKAGEEFLIDYSDFGLSWANVGFSSTLRKRGRFNH